MRKKIIAALVLLLLCCPACAKADTDNKSDVTAQTASEAKDGEEAPEKESESAEEKEPKKKGRNEDAVLLFDEPICLHEDDKFTVNFKGVFQEAVDYGDGPITQKGILLDVMNHSGSKCLFDLEDIYLGDMAATFSTKSGAQDITNGKTREEDFAISKDILTFFLDQIATRLYFIKR